MPPRRQDRIVTLDAGASDSGVLDLPGLDGAGVLHRGFVSPVEADTLFKQLTRMPIWHVPVETMWGKEVTFPRMCASMCAEESIPRLGAALKDPVGWTPAMLSLKARVEARCGGGAVFSHCQMIWYRDGRDYIGLHRDRETPPSGSICSVSLGATRTLAFAEIAPPRRPPGVPRERYELTLRRGDLLWMSEAAVGPKSRFKHGVAAEPADHNGRVVITFRCDPPPRSA